MREIKDREQINKWLRAEGVDQYFDTPGLQFRAYQFEKNELITGPGVMLEHILFLVEGSLQIYGLRADGSRLPVNVLSKPAMLGDVEFCGARPSPFFVEARTRLVCLALPIGLYGEALNRDLRFLHVLIRSFVEKQNYFELFQAGAGSLEERVLAYLERISPSREINGVEEATICLQCSRRQMQRVLKKLCDEGRLVRLGKGRYRLQ